MTEASYAIERGMDILADELGMDAVELRKKNFIRKDQFPYPSALGFTYDSGDYHKTLDVALEKIGYAALLKEQAEKRARGELMGIGFSTFTEVVGAGPSKHFDILGIKMFDSAEIRIHPTGAGIVRTGAKSQGQGHETTWAQVVAEELGLDPQNIMVEEGDTDTAPYGLGTYASRSTPVAGAAIVMAARRIREKARKIAAHLLEVGEGDVEWTDYKFQVKGVPSKTVTMKEVAFAAYTNMAQNEPGLEATYYYDPPNMTYPERGVRGGRGHRSRDRRDEGAPLPRRRRLRHRHQPDDRRRADPRRADRRLRDGVHPGDPVRRRGQQPEHELHGLPRADFARDAALGDGEYRDAEPAPSDGRERRGGEPERRQPGRVRQRRHRCAVAAGRAAHRHAAHARQGVARDPRRGSRAATGALPEKKA